MMMMMMIIIIIIIIRKRHLQPQIGWCLLYTWGICLQHVSAEMGHSRYILKYTKKNCCTISSVYMRSHFTIHHFILKCNLGTNMGKSFCSSGNFSLRNL